MKHGEPSATLKDPYAEFVSLNACITVQEGWSDIIGEFFDEAVEHIPSPGKHLCVHAIRADEHGFCLVEYHPVAGGDPAMVQLFDNICSDLWHYSPQLCERCGRQAPTPEGEYVRTLPPRVRCDGCDSVR